MRRLDFAPGSHARAFLIVCSAAMSTHATGGALAAPLSRTAPNAPKQKAAAVQAKQAAQVAALLVSDDVAVDGGRARARADAALFRYQQALDLLSSGEVSQARALLESARKQLGDTPEINLLLAYLLQREGRADSARNRLQSVSSRSMLASAYIAQLEREAPLPIGDTTTDADDQGETSANRDDGTQGVDDEQAAGDNGLQQAAAGATNPGGNLVIGGTIASFKQNNKNLAILERSLLRRVNAERTKRNLIALTWDEKLAAISRAHSLDMRDKKYFAHESPNAALREPLDRYRAIFGRKPRIIAENVFRSWGSPRTLGETEIEAAHDALMKSPGHRSNILLQGVTHIGIGIISNTNGDLWVTQMFSKP